MDTKYLIERLQGAVTTLEDRSPPECDASCDDPLCPYTHDWGPTRAERDESEIARLRAKIERMREGLLEIDAIDPESYVRGFTAEAMRPIINRMGQIARAALEDTQ